MSHSRHLTLSLAAALVALPALAAGACRRTAVRPAARETSHVATTERTFTDQATHGAGIYGASCARCHGADGRGTSGAPALVGEGALPVEARPGANVRTGRFATVADVQRFVKASMPPSGPRLSESQAWAVVAFALSANGVTRAEPLDPASAAAIPLGR